MPEDGKINTLDSAHLKSHRCVFWVCLRARPPVCVCVYGLRGLGYGQTNGWLDISHRNRIVKIERRRRGREREGSVRVVSDIGAHTTMTWHETQCMDLLDPIAGRGRVGTGGANIICSLEKELWNKENMVFSWLVKQLFNFDNDEMKFPSFHFLFFASFLQIFSFSFCAGCAGRCWSQMLPRVDAPNSPLSVSHRRASAGRVGSQNRNG